MKPKKLNNWIARLAPAMLLMACAQAVAGDFRVGMVDVERILRESVPAVKAGKKIEKEFSTRDQEIKKNTKQMKDMQANLDKEGVTLTDSERRNQERELANLNLNVQRMQREFGEDLNMRQNEELSAVLQMTNKAIKAIAESEKYDLILQEAAYHNPNINITEKVLKYLAAEKPVTGNK